MSIRHSGLVLWVGACWALTGCATSTPPVADKPPEKTTKSENPGPNPADPGPPDGGLRVGNMLELPKDDELRPSNPAATGDTPGGTAPVIVSPPPAPPTKPAP